MSATWALYAITTWALHSRRFGYNAGVVLSTTWALHLVLMGLDVWG